MVTKATDQFPDLLISKTTFVFISVLKLMFELGTGEQIFIDLTNSKLKFDFDAKPKMSENEDF